VLSVSGISKTRGVRVLDSVTFNLCAGEGIAIRGHNGCGKTTLLDIISGIRKQDGGSFSVNANIGYVMQKCCFQEGLSAMDNLRLEAALCGLKGTETQDRIRRCILDCDLEAFLKKRTDRLSEGMRGRLNIALALMSNPGLLLLDEAFNALDAASRLHIKAGLKQRKAQGMAILSVSHNPEDFYELCERVLEFPSEKLTQL